MTHRRFRPWVIHTIEFVEGAVLAVVALFAFCIVIEAFTGINPIWIVEALLK